MKTILIILFATLLVAARAQRFDWVNTGGYAGIANSYLGAVDIEVDNQGNIYTLDYANAAQQCQGDTAHPFGGSGSYNTFIYKFNPEGEIQKIIPVGTIFYPFNLETDPEGNLYLLGMNIGPSLLISDDTLSDMTQANVLVKLSPQGEYLWHYSTDYFSNYESCMLELANGHVYLQSGPLTISKLDLAGNVTATLTATFYDSNAAFNGVFFKGSGTYPNGDLAFAAISYGDLSFGTDTLFKSVPSTVSLPALFLRCNENLELEWARYFEGVRDPDYTTIPIVIDSDEAIYAGLQVKDNLTAGDDEITNDENAFTGKGAIIKIDGVGNGIWARPLIGSQTVYPVSMLNLLDGSGFFCGGQFTTEAQFGSVTVDGSDGTAFVAKLDYEGNFQHAFAFGEITINAKCLAAVDDENYLVGGIMYTSEPVFSCEARTPNNGFYVAKFSEEPDEVPVPGIEQDGNLLTATPDFSGDIQWLRDGIALPGETGQQLTATQSGDYQVMYTYTTGCIGSAISEIMPVIVTSDHTINASDPELLVFPNPTRGLFQIKSHDGHGSLQVKVLTISGRIILWRTLHSSSEWIDLSAYPDGLYVVRVESDFGVNYMRIVKNH